MRLSLISSRRARKSRNRFLLSVFLIVTLLEPLSTYQVDAMSNMIRNTVDSTSQLLVKKAAPVLYRDSGNLLEPQYTSGPEGREQQVTRFRLCPRRLILHVGEDYTLVPVPLDHNREAVHGVRQTWNTGNDAIATVSSYGQVTAIAPGNTVVTVRAGIARATALVEVRAGARLQRNDLAWDVEHDGDCDEPEASELNESQMESPKGITARVVNSNYLNDHGTLIIPGNDTDELGDQSNLSIATNNLIDMAKADRVGKLEGFKEIKRFALSSLSQMRGQKYALKNASGKKIFSKSFFSLIDGDGSDNFSANATQLYNAIGSPRFSPQEVAVTSAHKTRNNLGSFNYLFTAPVLSLRGRGIDVDLALNYNSRLWNKDGNTMTFNFNKGWPAAGWTLGYGRIITNYDNTASGDGSGIGLSNKPGNFLLVQPDGTRIHLEQHFDTTDQRWKHDSTDGSFLHLTHAGSKLEYPDGVVVNYDTINNRLLPTSIRTRNGDLITIAYRSRTGAFPFRWAINSITDTLGRIIQFNYYGDSGYPADPTNGKPLNALATITAPGLIDQGQTTRTLVQLFYQDITLQYNFGSMTVVGPGNNSQLTVIRRIYYPQTGRGYLFMDYSSYGMARHISSRIGMTGAGGTVTDGTEIAYTKYNYTSISTQVGTLNDSPQYTMRSEWWQSMTDGNGTPILSSNPTNYLYSRTVGAGFQIDKVEYPDGLKVETKTDNFGCTGFPGTVCSVVYKDISQNILRSEKYAYTAGPDGGLQYRWIEIFDEANQPSRVEFSYDDSGRLRHVFDQGYKHNDNYVVRRRITYSYLDSDPYMSANLRRLITEVRVFDGLLDNDNSNDTQMARTVYSYDDYKKKGGMTSYGGFGPNHDAAYDQFYTVRGNVTGVQTFSALSPGVSTTKYAGYDVYGNSVETDVSCCSVKSSGFSPLTYWSQPDSVTNGKLAVVPYLTTSFQYDFNTGLVLNSTDPNGEGAGLTRYGYDLAWRLLTAISPAGAIITTTFDRDSNGNDQLAYSQKLDYSDISGAKSLIIKSWLDGTGHAIRKGSAPNIIPLNFDAVASVYDSMGRMAKQSNPYLGNDQGIGSPSHWTTTTYDALSRVMRVTLPDNQFIQTDYAGATQTSGATITITDQVGRKRKTESDGLGRMVKVVEQNPSTGLLDETNYKTTYSYDALDNLTGVNQGNQTRSFTYDALSRVTQQITPEEGAVTYAYTDFDAVKKRTDARGVEKHYKYDSLNRVIQVWYTGLGGSDDGTVRPPLPTGVAATSDVLISYNNFTQSEPGNGLVRQVTDSVGNESYAYDGFARVQSKTRVIEGRSYQTQYQYNQIGQTILMIYPSGKRVRTNHNHQGRMSGLDKVDTVGNVLGTYASAIGYTVSGQVNGMTLGNSVVESYGYSADRLQLVSQIATKSGNTLMNMTYSYQAAAGASGVNTTAGNSGELVSVASGSTINGQARNQSFTYDNLGRLLTATGWGAWQRRYGYDRWGNRTGMWDATVGGNQLQSIAIAATSSVANNRIGNVNSVVYSYDATGNVTNDGLHSYSYDAESRLASVDGGTTASYLYDANNWRVKKASGGANTHYLWEGAQAIAEHNGANGAVISEYIYAGARMLAREQGGAIRYFHQDRFSTRLITDGNGLVVGTMDHHPFGEDASTGSGESEKHRFTSYERDGEANTDYAMNRQYATSIGRFKQPDVVYGTAGVPQSLNRYTYSLNDPINLFDPLGLSPGDATCLIDGFQAPCEVVFNLIRVGAVFVATYIPHNGERKDFDVGRYYEYKQEKGPTTINEEGQEEETTVFRAILRDREYEIDRIFFLHDLQNTGVFSRLVYQPKVEEHREMVAAEVVNPRAVAAWIARVLFKKLPREVGKADARKFARAVQKGIVGPYGQSGIKILDSPVGKYTHELKIGESAQRILGYVDEHGVIIFDKLIRGGLHK